MPVAPKPTPTVTNRPRPNVNKFLSSGLSMQRTSGQTVGSPASSSNSYSAKVPITASNRVQPESSMHSPGTNLGQDAKSATTFSNCCQARL